MRLDLSAAADPVFVGRLEHSIPAVMRVAEWLHRDGADILIPGIQYRAAGQLLFDDPGDIIVVHQMPTGSIARVERIETRQFKHPFTSHLDFPYRSIIVTDVCKYERALPKPSRHFFVNPALTAAAVVHSASIGEWWQADEFSRGPARRVYKCPIAVMEFIAFTFNGGNT